MIRSFLMFPLVVLIGVVGTATTSTASTIAALVMVVAPFVLKYVNLSGAWMALVSYLVALAVTIGAGFASGEVSSASFNVANLAATSAALWAVSQGVYQLFKDHSTFGALVK